MIPVTVAKVHTFDEGGFKGIGVILLDEQRQRALPLQLSQPVELEGIALHRSFREDLARTALARPRTLDLLTELLKALGGELEEVEIDLFQQNLLYARVCLQDQHGRHVMKAPLDDALPLAIRLKSAISVAETVPEDRWLELANEGTAREQQLETILYTMQTNPALLTAKKEPRNLDFAHDLQDWQFMSDPERFDYAVEQQASSTGAACLAITLRENPADERGMAPPTSALIRHEGFLADHYRGQRLRMRSLIKVEYLQHIHLYLTVIGPPVEQEANDADGQPSNAYSLVTDTTVGPATNTKDWVQQELTIDVPEDAFFIFFHLVLEGVCKIWLAGIGIEKVEKSTTPHE
jgi:bifunctional DNase/RNase